MATRPVCRAARYSPAGKHTGGSGLREGESKDEAEGDNITARLADKIAG